MTCLRPDCCRRQTSPSGLALSNRWRPVRHATEGTTEGRSAMTAIVNQIEVGAPAAAVFEYVTDPERFPEWQANVVGGSMDHEAGIGAVCSTPRRIGGRERQVTSEVTKYDPPS